MFVHCSLVTSLSATVLLGAGGWGLGAGGWGWLLVGCAASFIHSFTVSDSEQ